MSKLLNGFNNGRDTTDGVGGRPGPNDSHLTAEINLKQILKPWGNYTAKGQTVLLYDNAYFKDKTFLELCKKHQVRILPDLFTDVPDDKE